MYHEAGPSCLLYCLGAEEDGGDVCVEQNGRETEGEKTGLREPRLMNHLYTGPATGPPGRVRCVRQFRAFFVGGNQFMTWKVRRSMGCLW